MRFRPLLAALLLLTSTEALAAKCPNLYIVLDRSGSMTTATTGSNTRWGDAKAAIKTLTEAKESLFRFGLYTFPTPGSTACSSGQQLVASNFFTASSINTKLATINPGGNTPTADALKAVKTQADLTDTSRRKFVILITDGEPTCPNYYNGTYGDQNLELQADADLAVNAVKGLRNTTDATKDVKTFVVGFGGDLGSQRAVDTLTRMANEGGLPRKDAGQPPYYTANDSASLQTVLNQIVTVASGEIGTSTGCDDSCYSADNKCPTGQICTKNVVDYGNSHQLNLGKCTSDPCAGKACAAGEYCTGGVCKKSCPNGCGTGEYCNDGTCAADPCANGVCACTPTCALKYLTCLPGNTCGDDPCRYITCPNQTDLCIRGGCAAVKIDTGTNPFDFDGGSAADAGSGSSADAGGGADEGAGCACSAGSGAMSLGLALMLVGFLFLPRRRQS